MENAKLNEYRMIIVLIFTFSLLGVTGVDRSLE